MWWVIVSVVIIAVGILLILDWKKPLAGRFGNVHEGVRNNMGYLTGGTDVDETPDPYGRSGGI